MKHSLLSLTLALTFSTHSLADVVWHDLQSRSSSEQYKSYRQLSVEYGSLMAELSNAPMEYSGEAPLELTLPLPDGGSVILNVYESPVLESSIAAQYPDIKTFRASGKDDASISGRLDFTPNGFHAMLRIHQETIFINPESSYQQTNPQYNSSTNIYRSLKKSTQQTKANFSCGIKSHQHDSQSHQPQALNHRSYSGSNHRANKSFGSVQRTYRLALAATAEYASVVAGGVASATFAEMTTAINRVNEIYERDLGIRLLLVSDASLISSSIGQLTNNDGNTLIDENRTWIETTNSFSSNDYDIGHIFSTGGGGIAELASVCESNRKAGGVTGLPNPTGDTFYIDFVAHEIGHQFGATHTFNANSPSAGECFGNRETNENGQFSPGSDDALALAASAYEVGSGSTVMAYAGICNDQNIQNSSDAYFHARSIEQIRDFVEGNLPFSGADGSICGSSTHTGDEQPSIDAGNDFTIPTHTPFVLTGYASDNDSNSDTFIYTWEQFDLGAATTSATQMHTDLGSGPLIRSRAGTSNPKRYIPLTSAITSNNFIANSGERLPTTDRELTFMLTVRTGEHGVNQDSVTLTVDSGSGPFQVTAPTNSGTFNGGSTETVSWNVANTNASPVNCTNVDIDFSNDGGSTFPINLTSNTTNDGSESIILPDLTTTIGRIKVQCSNNIFFDISPNNLSLSATNTFLTLSTSVDPSGNEGDEGITNFDFLVVLSESPINDVSVDFTVTGSGNNPADANDFNGSVLPTGTLTFTSGTTETSQTISIGVNGDTDDEIEESFTLTLSNANNASLAISTITANIYNDDAVGGTSSGSNSSSSSSSSGGSSSSSSSGSSNGSNSSKGGGGGNTAPLTFALLAMLAAYRRLHHLHNRETAL